MFTLVRAPAMRLVAFSFVALLCLCQAGVRAAGPGDVDRAEVAFQLGNEAVVRKDFRAALSHYFESNALAPNRAVVFNIARCYDNLDEPVEAYRYYLEHLALAQPDERTAVQAQAALERLAPKVALLDVSSDPIGATIYLDRKDLGAYGVTPKRIAVKPGTHVVLLEAPNHDPSSQPAEATLGSTTRVQLSLPWRHGSVVLRGRPEGAEIHVDDPKAPVVARLPATIDLTEGVRFVSVQQPGYVPQRIPVTVRNGETSTLDVRLEVESGTIVVQADEAGAVIRIDDQPAGFTPAVIDRVSVGRHRVSVSQEGYAPYVTEVVVTADGRVAVDATLAVGTEVVTASRSLETIAEAPASISVIPGLEIRAFGYDSLYDALRGTPGIFTTDDRTYPAFGVRGLSLLGDYGSHVQIQIDGHQMSDDWIGSSYTSYDLLAGLQPVERIEVVRGPASNLYGTGAMFGVVNLITPSEADEVRVRAAGTLLGAQTLRVQGDILIPLGDDRDGLWIYGGSTYRQPTTYYSQVYADGDGAGDGTLEGVDENVSFSTLGKLFVGKLKLQWYWNQQDHQIPTGAYDSILGDTTTHYADSRVFVDLKWEPELSADTSLLARLAWDRYVYLDHYAYAEEDGGTFLDTWDSDWLTAEVRVSSHLGESFTLTGGAAWELHFFNHTYGQTGDGTPYIDIRNPFQVLSAYASFELDATDWLHLSGGARVDGWLISELPQVDGSFADRSFLAVNPRLALRFDVSRDDVVKVLFARGFRAPSVFELAYNDGGAFSVPSPDLSPEVAYSSGVEYLRELGAGMSLTVAGFLNTYESLIELDTFEDSEAFQYTNSDGAITSVGGEVEVRKLFQRGLTWSFSYGVQHSKRGDIVDGQWIANSPGHAFASKLVLPLIGRELALTSRLTIESPRKDRELVAMPWIVLWDLGLWGQVPRFDFEYSLSVRNALDWNFDYPHTDENPDVRTRAPGMQLRAELRARF